MVYIKRRGDLQYFHNKSNVILAIELNYLHYKDLILFKQKCHGVQTENYCLNTMCSCPKIKLIILS
jgi:hypothetical protein